MTPGWIGHNERTFVLSCCARRHYTVYSAAGSPSTANWSCSSVSANSLSGFCSICLWDLKGGTRNVMNAMTRRADSKKGVTNLSDQGGDDCLGRLLPFHSQSVSVRLDRFDRVIGTCEWFYCRRFPFSTQHGPAQ